MTGTSSANPDKLTEYVTAHALWVGDMRAKARTFADEVAFYNRSSSVSPKVDADLAANLADLVDRWAHLDDFIADVAAGFHELRSRWQGPSTWGGLPAVLTFRDTSIARFGHVGYADREEAEREAREVAEALQEAADNENISLDELNALLDDVARGQHDQAFAAELSNRLGVAGYIDTAAMIRRRYDDADEDGVSEAGHGAVMVLAATVTTAMHASEPRLSARFERDLLDYDPDGDTRHEVWPNGDEQDLAVLVGYSDPPTELAVRIANMRISPRLDSAESGGQGWGDRGGVVSNYAEMLSRNEDASAEWLARSDNLEMVLQRDTSKGGPPSRGGDRDGGRALAEVVENGLTNNSPAYDVTHSDAGETLTVGRYLMNESVEIVADLDQLRNGYLPEALVVGFDHHIDLIDQRINIGWNDPNLDGRPTRDAERTFDFFKNVTRDRDAADQVAASAERYVIEQVAELPPAEGTGDEEHQRLLGLKNVARVRGVIVGAEGELLIDDAAEFVERQQQRAEVVNFAVGLVPYYPQAQKLTEAIDFANALAEPGGHSVGDHMFPADLDGLVEQFNHQQLRQADAMADSAMLLYLADHPDELTVPLREMTPPEREAFISRIGASFDEGVTANRERVKDQSILFGDTLLAANRFAGEN